MKDLKSKMTPTRIVGVIGVIAVILGTLLPYIKFNYWYVKVSVSLVELGAGYIIVLSIINLAFMFLDVFEEYKPDFFNSTFGTILKKCEKPSISMIPTTICAVFAIRLTIGLMASYSYSGLNPFKLFSIGFYIMWIGTICLVVYAFLRKKEYDNNSQTIQPVNNMQPTNNFQQQNNMQPMNNWEQPSMQNNNQQFNNVQPNMQYNNSQENNAQYNAVPQSNNQFNASQNNMQDNNNTYSNM